MASASSGVAMRIVACIALLPAVLWHGLALLLREWALGSMVADGVGSATRDATQPSRWYGSDSMDAHLRSPRAVSRDAPERATPKPTVPRRALPRRVQSIRDGSPVADQSAAAPTGARALATLYGIVSAPLMAP